MTDKPDAGYTGRLDRFLCESLGISRSEAKSVLAAGRVTVNGLPVRKADTRLRPGDAVTANGAPLAYQKFVYLMLDKPVGVVSASADTRDVTAVDLVRDSFPRRELFCAGRLDKDSTGFMLLTDDGAFAHAMLAPKRHVAKTYLVRIDTPLTPAMQDGFAAGVQLTDGTRLAPAVCEGVAGDATLARVVLTQGVYHQIKRMFGIFGAGVVSLRRVAIGDLALDESLGAGGWREISDAERRLILPEL